MFPPKAGLNKKGDRKPFQFADLLKLNEQLRVASK